MKGKLKQFTIILLAHFLVFPTYFASMSKLIQQLTIFGSIMIYVFLNYHRLRPLYLSLVNHSRIVIISLVSSIILISTSFFIPIIYKTYDFSYFSEFQGVLIYLFFYIILIGMIRSYFPIKNTKLKMLEIISLVQRNYVLTTVFFLIFPRIKNMWLSLIVMTPRQFELTQEPRYVTRVSWDGYAGFTSTIFCTITVIISIYLINEYYREHGKINFNYLITLFISLVGNAFYGRSGLAISLLMVAIGVIYLVVMYKQYKLLYFISGSIISLLLLLAIISIFNERVATWYYWVMEPIINLLETGRIQSKSTNILWDMWFVPNFKTIFMGDGYYTSPITTGYYMGTDVGFLRPILFFGILFASLYYLVPIMLAINIAKYNNRNSKLLIAMLLIAVLLFEIKGESIFQFLPIITMLFIASNVGETLYTYQYKMENNYNFRSKLNEYYLD